MSCILIDLKFFCEICAFDDFLANMQIRSILPKINLKILKY